VAPEKAMERRTRRRQGCTTPGERQGRHDASKSGIAMTVSVGTDNPDPLIWTAK
jgi:hypothetical protein